MIPGSSVRSKWIGVTATQPVRDRGEVGSLLALVVGRVAVDPVLAPLGLLLLQHELVAVDPLAEPRDLDAADLAAREVDVQQRAARQRHVLDLLDHPRRERGGGLELELLAEPEVHLARRRLLRDGDAGQAEHDALQRGRDRTRVGDVVAEVGAVVDARDDQLGREALDQPERREAHAVDRRAVGRVADLPSPKSTSWTHSGRRVVMPRPIAERLESGAITASSSPGTVSSARRSACRPSASMPSSFVSRTRTAARIFSCPQRPRRESPRRGLASGET